MWHVVFSVFLYPKRLLGWSPYLVTIALPEKIFVLLEKKAILSWLDNNWSQSPFPKCRIVAYIFTFNNNCLSSRQKKNIANWMETNQEKAFLIYKHTFGQLIAWVALNLNAPPTILLLRGEERHVFCCFSVVGATLYAKRFFISFQRF